MGTSSATANNYALLADTGLNMLSGSVGNFAANEALFAKANALTTNYHVLKTTCGEGIPSFRGPSTFANSINVLGLTSNAASVYKSAYKPDSVAPHTENSTE